jgi:hypothetical protein
MQTNYLIKCNICETNIESKSIMEHTSAKQHQLKKTTLERDLLNLRSRKSYLEDFSVISTWIEGLSDEEKKN